MKIENPNDLGPVSSPSAKSTAGLESGVPRDVSRSVEDSGPDRAELSGLAGKISGAVGRDAANRAAKVEQLRGQVVEGGYSPDPVEISRGIVEDALANAATAGSSRK
jgi:hypothetical protein